MWGMHRYVIGLGLIWGLFQAAGAASQRQLQSHAADDEVVFVRGLIDEGFPALAKMVLVRALEKSPEIESIALELRVRIQIVEQHFDQALEQLTSFEEAESLWLFLAETARGNSQNSIAETAYDAYFKTSENPEDGLAAFHYGQLLEEQGNDVAARLFYEKIVKRLDSRPMKVRLAALWVEDDPIRALMLCEEVQLGGMDLWFGKAVVLWSQLMIQKEEWAEVQSVLETQLELLKQLEEAGALESQVSPLSGARYFLGICYEQAGEKAEALHQFVNVHIQYGDSEWGPLAQQHADELIASFEAQGQRVKIDLGANRSKMEAGAFRVGQRLFFERRYVEVVSVYLDALNTFPEGADAVSTLRDLLLSLIHLGDDLHAKTVAGYLGERFTAGDALLVAGKTALDEKKETLAWWIYDRYLETCPEHSRVPSVLFSLAGLRKQEAYLMRIVETYSESSYRVRALGRLAWNAFEAKEYEKAATRFEMYLLVETDPKKRTLARFSVAEAFRNMAQKTPDHRMAFQEQTGKMPVLQAISTEWKKALENFQTLEKEMIIDAHRFGVSKERLEFNQPFHEKSIYYQAVCEAQLGELDAATETCRRFIEIFPTSGIISQVRFLQGKTLVDAGNFSEALLAFEPFGNGVDSPFAESVFYYRGIAQLETGANEAAIQTLENLFVTWPSSAFFFEAKWVQGRVYIAEGRNEEAIRVLGDILNLASDDRMIHRASIELGRAQSDPREKLASFQRVALLADPADPQQAPLIAEALFESLPLYVELTRYQELLLDCERLTTEFPTFGNADEIERLRMKGKGGEGNVTADNADEHG